MVVSEEKLKHVGIKASVGGLSFSLISLEVVIEIWLRFLYFSFVVRREKSDLNA